MQKSAFCRTATSLDLNHIYSSSSPWSSFVLFFVFQDKSWTVALVFPPLQWNWKLKGLQFTVHNECPLLYWFGLVHMLHRVYGVWYMLWCVHIVDCSTWVRGKEAAKDEVSYKKNKIANVHLSLKYSPWCIQSMQQFFYPSHSVLCTLYTPACCI